MEVELAAELAAEVATDDRNILAPQELVDELDVPLGHVVAVSTDLEDVSAAKDLRPDATAVAARLLQRADQAVHRVDAEPGVIERLLATGRRRREHEVIHPSGSRDRIDEADGDARAEQRPDDRGFARRVDTPDVDRDLGLAAAGPLAAHRGGPPRTL